MRHLLTRFREQTFEAGTITLLHRPGVHAPGDGIQRLLLLLAPRESAWQRLLAIGRRATGATKFWGFVDLVLTPADMKAALAAQVFSGDSDGIRHVPPAIPFARGGYSISLHGEHSHLRWSVARLGDEIDIESEGDFRVTLVNPDPNAWGLSEHPDLQGELFDELELHVTVPAPLDPPLRDRFRGNRYTTLDRSDWLDRPGAELIFSRPRC